MDSFLLWAMFSIAVIVHLVIGYQCNEEIKKIGGGYVFVMVKLLKRQELKLKLAAISFFAYLFLGIALALKIYALSLIHI